MKKQKKTRGAGSSVGEHAATFLLKVFRLAVPLGKGSSRLRIQRVEVFRMACEGFRAWLGLPMANE